MKTIFFFGGVIVGTWMGLLLPGRFGLNPDHSAWAFAVWAVAPVAICGSALLLRAFLPAQLRKLIW